jgi:transcriptional regulator with XRE-family HTH domain
MERFAKRLKERAAELGVSHAEAARRSGLSERRFSNYVSGIREPDLALLVRIAEALQTTPNDLLGMGDKRKSTSRMLLVDRLNSAAEGLSDHDLEVVTVQTEALSGQSRKKRRPAK